jgi:hypothetical protein
MAEEVNFLDLAALSRIGPDTVVEKFGGLINSSFFDASNILGTLKLKGLIDFSTMYAGQNAIVVTDQGKQLLGEANAKASQELDPLDTEILARLSRGKMQLQELGGSVNLAQRDLALRVYKLTQQQFASYSIRNGTLDIMLTEKGFLKAKEEQPKPQQAAQQQQAAPRSSQPEQQAHPAVSSEADEIASLQGMPGMGNQNRMIVAVSVIAVIVIIVAALFILNVL